MRPGLIASEVGLVSMTPRSPAFTSHLGHGGVGATYDGVELVLNHGSRRIGSIDCRLIPATLDGQYLPAVTNALFAVVAAYGAGISFDTIHAALVSFESTPEANPGRMNRVPGLPYDLWVTWADGAEAAAALCNFFQKVTVQKRRLLMICCMGNRPDNYIKGMAVALAPAFDLFVCSDWEDLRGRPPGEAASLLAGALEGCGIDRRAIHVASDHKHGLFLALNEVQPGDLLLVVTLSGEKVLAEIKTTTNPQPGVGN